jgi:hypothetical protein
MTKNARCIHILFLAAAISSCAGQRDIPGSVSVAAPQNAANKATGKPTVSPKKLDFTTTPTLKLTVTEKGYSGNFTFSSSPKGIVKVHPSKGKGPSVSVEVTAVSAGSATLIVSDDHKGSATVAVTVSQAVIIIQ